MIAVILWTAFGLGILLGLLAVWVSDHRAAWAAGLISTILLLAFSFAGGFSVGPFAIALPILVTALTVSRGMAVVPQLLIVVGAAGLYWVVTWGFEPMRQARPGWPIVDTLLIVAAYLAALLRLVLRRYGASRPD